MKDKLFFWWSWLLVATLCVVLMGLVMNVAPGFTRRIFGTLLFTSGVGVDSLGEQAVAYISLVHGVLGAVMVGWGVAMLLLVLGPFRRASYHAWLTMTVSLVAWFVPDTLVSLRTGFWQNAILNTVFIVVFAVPLIATYRACREPRA